MVKLSRPRSPSVAEELAEAAPDGAALHRAAMRRATIHSVWPEGSRYTFEDGSCIEFEPRSEFVTVKPNCEE